MSEVRPVGRMMRLIFGIGALSAAISIFLGASFDFIQSSLGIVVALIMLYSVLHYLVAQYFSDINRWIGAMLAVIPVALVFMMGESGGQIFGRGEGAAGALTFLGISYIIDYIRGDSGCEVMAIPGVLFRNRTHLACIVLTPLDILEEKLSPGR